MQRKEQMSDPMAQFVEAISGENKVERMYFLQWFQLMLNNLSDEVMPDIRRNFNACKKEPKVRLVCKK